MIDKANLTITRPLPSMPIDKQIEHLTNQVSAALSSIHDALIGDLTIVRAGGRLSFYGGQPATQPATVQALVDNSRGKVTNNIPEVSGVMNVGSADLEPVRDAIANLTDRVNKILVALKSVGLIAT